MTVDALIDKQTLVYVRTMLAEKGGGGRYFQDAELRKLLAICGDVDLLSTALAMSPRPSWVKDVTG